MKEKKKRQMECFHPQNILLSSHYVNKRTMIDMVSSEETLVVLTITRFAELVVLFDVNTFDITL